MAEQMSSQSHFPFRHPGAKSAAWAALWLLHGVDPASSVAYGLINQAILADLLTRIGDGG